MARTVARPRHNRPPEQRLPQPLRSSGQASTTDTRDRAITLESEDQQISNRPNQTATTSIPLEMLGAVLEHVDDKQFLLQSRLLSRDFKSAADPWAFRTLSVSRNQKSRDGYLNIANSPELAIYVKEVRFRTYGQGVDANDDTNGDVLSDIGVITKFAHVNALQLHFQSGWVESLYEDEEDQMSPVRRLQIAAIKALAVLHSNHGLRLQELEIHGLISRSNESILADSFKALLEPLTSLAISVVTNDAENFCHSDDDYCAFWDNDINIMLNTVRNLTSLTLISDIDTFYDWSKVDTFLKLEYLNLEKFVFGFYFSPEPFILRHKNTLRCLDLSECSIDVDTSMVGGPSKPRLWADIFKTFEEELDELLAFKFDPFPGLIEGTEDFPEYNGYVWLDTEEGYKNSFDDDDGPVPESVEKDSLAFESLQKILTKRVGKSPN